jgi:hypothetical protein
MGYQAENGVRVTNPRNGAESHPVHRDVARRQLRRGPSRIAAIYDMELCKNEPASTEALARTIEYLN